MKIFVIHYDKLVERKKNIDYQLKLNNISAEFISNKSIENITYTERKMFRNIKDVEMSICLHHIECFKKIANLIDIDYALILEDDVILCDNFINILNKYISLLPPDFDMLFIGDGCGMHIPKNQLINNKFIYKKDNYPSSWGGLGATKCLDSYIISKKCAELIINKLKLPNYTILCPADHWLNHVIRNNNLNVYWAEPTIVKQGSENKFFKSSVR
jgi:GR25 family glycosyltransferase involved in LPS biosynthesis